MPNEIARQGRNSTNGAQPTAHLCSLHLFCNRLVDQADDIWNCDECSAQFFHLEFELVPLDGAAESGSLARETFSQQRREGRIETHTQVARGCKRC